MGVQWGGGGRNLVRGGGLIFIPFCFSMCGVILGVCVRWGLIKLSDPPPPEMRLYHSHPVRLHAAKRIARQSEDLSCFMHISRGDVVNAASCSPLFTVLTDY